MRPGLDIAPLCAATCAADGTLIAAGEPLAGLQLACGGVLPGPIAIPALADLVRQARALGLKLARAIAADDGEASVRAWVEVDPDAGEGTCHIAVRSWQAEPHVDDEAATALRHRLEIDRALAELTAQLDARQGLLAVEGDAPDLRAAVQAMRGGIGRPWTDFASVEGGVHQQPLHWRLLDGARVTVPGSTRGWRALLVPFGAGGDAPPPGFELLLVSDEVLLPPPPPPVPEPAPAVIGREVAPVLRPPIARIIANAETIHARLAGPLSADYARYAGDIAHAGTLLQQLVNDLADLEVIEDADFATAADPVDLAEAARQAAGILGVRARERQIQLAVPPAGEHATASAEFGRVLQILLNLIGNAIRYAPENTVVTISVVATDGHRGVVVADQGAGLSPEQQARVFDKFERLGRSGDGGTGLGLYISRRLARAMGGDLSVESALGEGARFVLTLPGAQQQ